MPHRAHSTLCVLLLAALTGCTARYAPDESIVLDTAGPFAVDVRAFAGDVVVRTDPDIERATVKIVRAAIHGAKRTREAEASLNEIDYGVELLPGDLGPVLQVRTSTRHAEPHFQRTHVYIDAREVDGVSIHTARGEVIVRDGRGAVDISTSQGDVRYMTNWPLTDPVTIMNDGGDIDLRARGESTGIIDGQSVRGKVSQRVEQGRLIVQPGSDAQNLSAILNDGENPVTLRTVDGDIRFVVKSNPTEVGKVIK